MKAPMSIFWGDTGRGERAFMGASVGAARQRPQYGPEFPPVPRLPTAFAMPHPANLPQPAPTLVLGSSSPYRRELLARLGLPFEVHSPDVDEAPRPTSALPAWPNAWP